MNYELFYQKIEKSFSSYKTIIQITNKITTYLMYILYPVLLILSKDIKILFIPMISFILVSVVRDKINRPRPYETHPIHPIIIKDTKGHSMPSRHVFSAVIISMSYLYVNTTIGIILLLISFILGMMRIIGGVHYISDVVVGYVIGLLCGLLYFM
ncbi:phosphatase PAP2 family protein [Floccifex sp.]|uniref:phosphatase PAP2 family protein n=1 Tax=Floccifex sp. TaxID=2815810 RepID=UPI002A74D5FC|nr:phosphatase PAP2 family protein [Floccifex sp.]MDD7280380.1 phosphatase PAP2 family protein [Erysipelotrichaceae bacterium]MDY2957957.1 phosphatase PAP2 family protein [Floccifex sp.]